MATSPNFSWPEPDNTDLVKNGALAIRTAINAIDTSMVDLKGGTTGQVLSKATNTDMDFTWVTDATGIPATIFDAKGDIIAATAADTASRLAVGANNTVLTADSSTATGLKWATPAGGGGKVLQVVSTTYATETVIASTTMTDTGITLSITPTLNTSKILVLMSVNSAVYRASSNAAGCAQLLRGATTLINWTGTQENGWQYINSGNGTTSMMKQNSSIVYLDSPATTSSTTYKLQGRSEVTSSSGQIIFQHNAATSTITLMEIGA